MLWMLIALSLGSAQAAAQTADSAAAGLAPLAFLIGDWQAASSGHGADPAGGFSFAWAVQNHVIVRANHADYPPADGRPAYRHEDLMVIYVDGGALRAEYFDNEGHVIRYAVQPSASGEVTFVSDLSAQGPRFRLSYRLTADQALNGRFEIAPPSTPDAFAPFLFWTARKAGPAR